MSESGDYDPGPWKGYDFGSARKAYDVHVGRSYSVAVSAGVTKDDLVPDNITTESSAPVVIVCDGTGSMGSWPATIFSKLPYLDIEGKEYLGEDMKISYAMIGDANYDKYALQVQPFVAGKEMETVLQKLIIEGGGGGNQIESYELAALYYARNCEMTGNPTNPLFIFIGDEGVSEMVSEGHAADWAKVKDDGDRLSTHKIIRELQRKFSVYLVRKPYGTRTDGYADDVETRIHTQWEKLLGADHVSILPDAARIVDVIFGIFAKETGRIDYFKKEIQDRQTPEQVDTVMKSLNTVHTINKTASKKKLPVGSVSITNRTAGTSTSNSISLL